MRSTTFFASLLFAARWALAIDLNLDDPASIKAAAKTAADGMMKVRIWSRRAGLKDVVLIDVKCSGIQAIKQVRRIELDSATYSPDNTPQAAYRVFFQALSTGGKRAQCLAL